MRENERKDVWKQNFETVMNDCGRESKSDKHRRVNTGEIETVKKL